MIQPEDQELLRRFAAHLRRRYAPSGRLYVLGSRVRGTAAQWGDFDLIFVSSAFAGRARRERIPDRFAIWREVGGYAKALDMHVYTPGECRAVRRAATCVADSEHQRELIRVG